MARGRGRGDLGMHVWFQLPRVVDVGVEGELRYHGVASMETVALFSFG